MSRTASEPRRSGTTLQAGLEFGGRAVCCNQVATPQQTWIHVGRGEELVYQPLQVPQTVNRSPAESDIVISEGSRLLRIQGARFRRFRTSALAVQDSMNHETPNPSP